MKALISTLALALGPVLVGSLAAERLQAPVEVSRQACTATAQNPIAICFPARPLVVDHCSAQLVPDFDVAIWHPPETATVGYRYSYQLVLNGKGGSTMSEPPAGSPGFPSTDTPINLSKKRVAYSGRARYALRVIITDEQQRVFDRVSPESVIEDKPRIRGMVVGVSAYDVPEYDLNYPAADAQVFHTALKRLLDGPTDFDVDLRTTDNQKDLSKEALLNAINATVAEPSPDASAAERERWEASRLCGENDWYVFYYSGHGIVGVDKNQKVGRYVSTPAFRPERLTLTSIRLTQLATALFDTSAKNILIVLDSCFSGSHRHVMPSRPLTPAGRAAVDPRLNADAHSSKVMYVANDTLQDAPPAGQGDSKVLRAKVDEYGRGVVLAASSADREAEEGPVTYTTRNGQLLLEFERSSVTANKKKPGHGLFTFAWVANLFAQLPESIDVSDILTGGKPHIGMTCMLKFDLAGSAAKTDIDTLGVSKDWELQSPEVMVANVPPPLRCGTGGD